MAAGSYTVTDLATMASGFLFILVLIGYISQKSYDLGYYKSAPYPSGHGDGKEYTLRQVSRSFMVLGFIIFIPTGLLFMSGILKENIIFNTFSLSILMTTAFFELVFFSSLFAGEHKRSRLSKSDFPIIEISIDSQPIKKVKMIYASDDAFLYCLTNDNEWSMVRKDKVLSVEGKDKKKEKSTKTYSLKKLLH